VGSIGLMAKSTVVRTAATSAPFVCGRQAGSIMRKDRTCGGVVCRSSRSFLFAGMRVEVHVCEIRLTQRGFHRAWRSPQNWPNISLRHAKRIANRRSGVRHRTAKNGTAAAERGRASGAGPNPYPSRYCSTQNLQSRNNSWGYRGTNDPLFHGRLIAQLAQRLDPFFCLSAERTLSPRNSDLPTSAVPSLSAAVKE